MADSHNFHLPARSTTSSFSVDTGSSTHQRSLDRHTGLVPRKIKGKFPINRSTAAPYHDNEEAQHEAASQEHDLEQSLRRSETEYTESNSLPTRNLGFLQITSLMINSMIGSGIFTVPGYTVLLTKSKTVALILWAVGGVYTSIW